YGTDSPQRRDSFFGALAEPHVSRAVLEGMLGEQPTIQVRRRTVLLGAEAAAGVVRAIRVRGPRGEESLAGRVFIDASYEGDLAAAAGFSFRVGRESTREYGERFAGHIYFQDGRILDGSTGAGDGKIQCYNFRVVMTEDPANAAPLAMPPDYRPERYERILEEVRAGRIQHPMAEAKTGVLRLQRLPNGKADMNDVNTSPVGFGLPGQNWDYPTATAARRAEIFEQHRRYALGLLYFLRSDPRLPEGFRAEARRWNLPKDEFAESGHFPPALYVREARRFPGAYVFTEHDVMADPVTQRSRLQPESVAVGDYVINSHGVDEARAPYPAIREGYVVFGTVPYQIPYGVLTPRGAKNLLVPGAMSASHVGFGALRLEPIWTALGQAAGVAAELLLADGAVSVRKLQAELHRRGAMTFYVADVARTSPLWEMVQRVGNLGFFHEPVEGAPMVTRRPRFGLQYAWAPDHHGARLDERLTAETRARGGELLGRAGWEIPEAVAGETRGAFLRRLRAPDQSRGR
ncbi:MAG: FAD-dependent oxidoreductase, partial [Acidobacteriaceae bacterium]|nr:FAD-dependent oxidoreductase [Acidobacteriaceae bacterium]